MTREIALRDVRLTEGFLTAYYRLVRDVMLPFQWEVMNDRVEGAEKSCCIENIEIAAGRKEGEHYGFMFQDSDASKWLEAVSYCLQNGDADGFEAIADGLVGLIGEAQQDDGYFNTYFQLAAPERKLTNLFEAHELYCLGHLIEAAVAYEQGTGKRKLLDIVIRFADLIDSRFGSDEGKLRGYPGHQEIELALAKLFEATGDEKYLKLGKFFIDERGREPHFFTQEWERRGGYSEWQKRVDKLPDDYQYCQAHLPVREQKAAVGHAVRAVYMYTAMAEIGRLSGDESLLDACRVIFRDICRQLYVTGGIGSTNHGEAFTFAFDLPNEINYSETCASIGLVFFMHSMLKCEINSVYADVIERALYNTILASVGTDGKSYFYVNPMEVVVEASEKNPARKHVKAQRQKWHACACCPPNLARLIASIGKYLYSSSKDTIYIHQYAPSQANISLQGGAFSFALQTEYPYNGDIAVTVQSAAPNDATLAFRIPYWCEEKAFLCNGKPVDITEKNGYAYITRCFSTGDVISVKYGMRPRVVYANSEIRANAGKVCLQRGPLVYCLEECDNVQNLSTLLLDTSADIKEIDGIISNVCCILLEAEGFTEREEVAQGEVYSFSPKKRFARKLLFVPYHLWGNRAAGEMTIWIRERHIHCTEPAKRALAHGRR